MCRLCWGYANPCGAEGGGGCAVCWSSSYSSCDAWVGEIDPETEQLMETYCGDYTYYPYMSFDTMFPDIGIDYY